MKRNTVTDLIKKKKKGEKITMLTAYDCLFAKIFDQCGIDAILVGDSLGMVFQGYQTTIPVTLEQIIYHTRIVVNSTSQALVVADLPFGTYQISEEEALKSAFRIIQETGCNAIKMEGGSYLVPVIKKLTSRGVPVYGHLGLTPQSINKFGSYRLRAKKSSEADILIEDAKKLQDAGVSGIILEKIPAELAKEVSLMLTIPTIGIGAGNGCDGQVLVYTDMLGLDENVNFKFVRKYANLAETVTNACQSYIKDVKSTDFPAENESY